MKKTDGMPYNVIGYDNVIGYGDRDVWCELADSIQGEDGDAKQRFALACCHVMWHCATRSCDVRHCFMRHYSTRYCTTVRRTRDFDPRMRGR